MIFLPLYYWLKEEGRGPHSGQGDRSAIQWRIIKELDAHPYTIVSCPVPPTQKGERVWFGFGSLISQAMYCGMTLMLAKDVL